MCSTKCQHCLLSFRSYWIEMIWLVKRHKTPSNLWLSILCLISRMTMTSLSALKDKRCKKHLCVNLRIPFWSHEKTQTSYLYHTLTSRSFSWWRQSIIITLLSDLSFLHCEMVCIKCHHSSPWIFWLDCTFL